MTLRPVFSFYLSLFIILFASSCGKNNVVDPTAVAITTDFALPPNAPIPTNNLQDAQKIALGKLLFFDPILSGNKDVACASCHQPNLAYTDNLDIAIGVNGVGLGTLRNFSTNGSRLFAKRNTPTIVNVAFNGITTTNGFLDPLLAPMFFDSRKQSLELQSLEPIKALEEMRGTLFTTDNALDSVVARLKSIAEYKTLFESIFPDAITSTNISKVIAAFERTIITNNSAYDRFIKGDANALNATQKSGFAAFKQIGCNKCHNGPMFSDYQLHILSVPDNAKIATDVGNGSYAFRTPTLRNLSLTAPYMHNGAFTSLDNVIKFYDNVGKGQSQNQHVANNQLDANLRGLNDNQRDQIIAFLQSLDDTSFDKTTPASVPSKLKVGGN